MKELWSHSVPITQTISPDSAMNRIHCADPRESVISIPPASLDLISQSQTFNGGIKVKGSSGQTPSKLPTRTVGVLGLPFSTVNVAAGEFPRDFAGLGCCGAF